MEDLKTMIAGISVKEILGKEASSEVEDSYKKMICTQQKLFTLTNMLCSGVGISEDKFVPAIEDGRDRLVIIKKILKLVEEF